MTDTVRKQVEQWFDDNFVGNFCIMCTSGVFKLDTRIHSIVVEGEESQPESAQYIAVKCTSCGHTLFYDGEIIGRYLLITSRESGTEQ